jgi:hypothetical protein
LVLVLGDRGDDVPAVALVLPPAFNLWDKRNSLLNRLRRAPCRAPKQSGNFRLLKSKWLDREWPAASATHQEANSELSALSFGRGPSFRRFYAELDREDWLSASSE